MKKRSRVFLYGKTVILGTVGASLQHYSDLEIVSLSPPFPNTSELKALAPDAIIFDLQAAQPDAALKLLDSCPNLILIGIDPGDEQVYMWAGKHMSALSAQDLAHSIRNNTPLSEEEPEKS
jgi:hypothetical protein